MSAVLAFVTGDSAVLAADSQVSHWDPDTGVVEEKSYHEKLTPMRNGWVASTGDVRLAAASGEILAGRVAGDPDELDTVLESAREYARGEGRLHVVQVFVDDGVCGLLDANLAGQGGRYTEPGSAVVSGSPTIDDDLLKRVQQEAGRKALLADSLQGVADILESGVRFLAERSDFVGGTVLVGGVTAEGEMRAFEGERT